MSASHKTATDAIGRRLGVAVRRRLGIDARALAALRIGYGAILLFDLGHRALEFRTFYTEAGVVPLAAQRDRTGAETLYSLYALSTEPWATAALFAVAAAAAVALLVGYRTRVATLVSVALLYSLHVRNTTVLNAADYLLVQLLLLAVFLPLGARWSLDARRRAARAGGGQGARDDAREDAPETAPAVDRLVVTPATAAFLLYVVSLFLGNALAKHEGDTWYAGRALHYALGNDQMTVYLGPHLAEYPALLEVGTYAWVGLLAGSPLLVLAAGRLRAAYAGAFVGAACGMAATMAVGLFPAVLVATLSSFLPPSVWDRLEAAGARAVAALPVDRPARSARPRGDGGSNPGVGWQPSPAVRRYLETTWSVALVVVLAVVLLWSAGALAGVDTFEPVDAVDASEGRLTVYAPDPGDRTVWYLVAAELDDGEERDLLTAGTAPEGVPANAADTTPSFRWRKYLEASVHDDVLSAALAEWACDRAVERYGDDVESVRATHYAQPIDGGDVRSNTYAERSCSA